MEVIEGFPDCPECDALLHLREMPDAGETRWYCPKCNTQWDTPELIEALDFNETVACVMATERADNEV